MTDSRDFSTPFLLGWTRVTELERQLLTRSDVEAMADKVHLLTSTAIQMNAFVVAKYGGHGGSVRAPGLVEQVIAAAFQTFGDVDPYPEVLAKAAMLLRGVAGGHPFQDGNKRTSFILVMWYLDAMGTRLPPAFDVAGAVTLCVRVAAGDLRDLAAITNEIVRIYGGSGEGVNNDFRSP